MLELKKDRKIENFAITVTVTGNGSATDYVVTQEKGWSWRYGDGFSNFAGIYRVS